MKETEKTNSNIRVKESTRKKIKVLAARYDTTAAVVIEMLLKNTSLPAPK